MIELLTVLICLLLNGLLSATEMAFVSVGRPQLRVLSARGMRSATMLLKLKMNPERILSIIQVGITLVGAIAAAVSGAGAEEMLSPWLMKHYSLNESTAEGVSIVLIVLPLTYLNVVFGELIPKSISLKRPTRVALRSAFWLVLFDRLFSPLISLLEGSTKLVMTLLRLKPEADVMRDEDIVEIGNLKSETKRYVLNTISAEKKRAQDIMVPWDSVVRIQRTDSASSVEDVILKSGHTRLPVVADENIVGLLHTKEFLGLLKSGRTDWNELIRPILRFRGGEPILNVMAKMQESRSHLAAVYDRMKVNGVVTLEDVIEEIVGDLYDEDDDGGVRRFYGRAKR